MYANITEYKADYSTHFHNHPTSMKPIQIAISGVLRVGSAALHAQETSSTLERCDHPLGSIAVSESRGTSASALQSYGLGSPAARLRGCAS